MGATDYPTPGRQLCARRGRPLIAVGTVPGVECRSRPCACCERRERAVRALRTRRRLLRPDPTAAASRPCCVRWVHLSRRIAGRSSSVKLRSWWCARQQLTLGSTQRGALRRLPPRAVKGVAWDRRWTCLRRAHARLRHVVNPKTLSEMHLPKRTRGSEDREADGRGT